MSPYISKKSQNLNISTSTKFKKLALEEANAGFPKGFATSKRLYSPILPPQFNFFCRRQLFFKHIIQTKKPTHLNAFI